MKKKGFTLVELLAVIVILGIIMSIATPIIIKVINDSKKETYKLSMSGYVKAVEEQIAVNKAKGKITKNGKYNISVNDLITNGYVRKTKDGKIYNPINKEEINGCFVVENSGQYNQLTYTYMESCN